MLVLTRKSQQSIRIGNEITVTILKVKGNAVSVGIDAPRSVRVVRGELGPLVASYVDGQASCGAAETDGSNGPANHAPTSDDKMNLAPATSPAAGSSLSEFVAQYQKTQHEKTQHQETGKSRKSGRYCQAS